MDQTRQIGRVSELPFMPQKADIWLQRNICRNGSRTFFVFQTYDVETKFLFAKSTSEFSHSLGHKAISDCLLRAFVLMLISRLVDDKQRVSLRLRRVRLSSAIRSCGILKKLQWNRQAPKLRRLSPRLAIQ